jgi:hypothetical protein
MVGAYVKEKGKESLTFSEPLKMASTREGKRGLLPPPPLGWAK